MMSAPSPAVLHSLSRLNLKPDEVLLSVPTDINAQGQYDEQWLVVTARTLLVFDPETGEGFDQEFSLGEIEAFRTTAAVGSGSLQGRVQGVWIDLLRYSNRLKHRFEQALHQLEQIQRGELRTPVAGADHDPQRCGNCGLMLEFVGEICPRCIDHGAALSRVAGMLKPYWKAGAGLFFLLLAGIALDMVFPLLTAFLVDHVLKEDTAALTGWKARFRGRDAHELLVLVVGAVAGVQVVRAVVNVFTAKIAGRVGNAMTYDVRTQLVQKLEQLGLAYYNKQETGSLVGRVAYDTDAIQGFIGQVTSGFVMQFFLVLFSFIMMLSLEPALALWAMLPTPFVVGGSYVYWRYVHPRYQRYWDRTSKQAGILSGLLTGIRVVKAFAQEHYELSRFQKASGSVKDTKDSLDQTAALFYPSMGIVFQVGGWLIWYVGGLNVLDRQLTVGTLMAFFGYLALFYGPLGNLTNLTTWLTQFSTQMHRIFEILDAPAVIPEARTPAVIPTPRGHVEFRDVTFSYSRGAPVLKNLSLELKPGERVGIVGRSGSGKTSLINLIYRFYDVDAGGIFLDGVDIRELSQDQLRSQISIVLQEPFLFRGSLAANIAYGQQDASPEDILEAARAASAHDFVMKHQLAYDTSVGERGQELSGGERQRVSIARALLRNSRILILDEATSAVDSESEQSIQAALDEGIGTRTCILIAHRLSTLQSCDRIYVLDQGRIAESGNHRELLKQNGLYAGWVKIQQGEQSVDVLLEDDTARTRAKGGPSGAHAPAGASASGLPPLTGHRPRWLEPDVACFSRGPKRDLQLRVNGEERVYRGLFALWCFPVRHRDKYISLRYTAEDGRTQEVGIVRDLAAWPPETQALLQEALRGRYLFHRIERIRSVKKVSNFLAFETKTNLGDVEFLVRYNADSIKRYGTEGKLLMDVEDNLYVLDDVKDLRRSEQLAFERFVYW